MKGTQNDTKKTDQDLTDLYKLEIMTFADFETIMLTRQLYLYCKYFKRFVTNPQT